MPPDRIFSPSSAAGFSLAAALAYAVAERVGQAMVALFWVLAAIAAYNAIGVLVEAVALMLDRLAEIRAEIARRDAIAADRDTLLADVMRTMTAPQVEAFRALAGQQYDPADPRSVILPGFAILTRAFAVRWFAESVATPQPVRAYAEGRTDRQREQCAELLDWLVTHGYATRQAYNTPAIWMGPDSPARARAELGISL